MPFETLATGYGLIEGPRVDERGNLYFSDVTNGGVYRRAPEGGIETIVPKRRGVGGIALHVAGGLVISGRDICHVRDGETRVLFRGVDVPGFNDIFTDADGRVYAGSLRSNPFGDEAERRPGELYRIDGENDAVELYSEVLLTNGIGLSPDGRTIWHSDTVRNTVLAHRLAADGRIERTDPAIRVEAGGPDGLAVDEEGCVWVAVYGGGCVQRFTPDGKLDRTLPVPASAVTSLCFGGGDRRDLYVVSADNSEDAARAGSIFRTRTDVAGLPVTPARI
ncbi:MAG: SMP-30/gluconolactonase/LRE family protein [Deltaproteobacteria bacterium]|nr:SMP-30/gluconolactonase/LRE family protein [Deltaproteobacteria bacterium]MBW2415462.1 SMP-30/gluconolactonase/LRE family protein [Deltaproteobacteria bacterium]